MKREEVEEKVKETVDFTKQKLSIPVPAFIAGIVIGFLLGGYPKLVLTILALVALGVGALWFFAEKKNAEAEKPAPANKPDNSAKVGGNGSQAASNTTTAASSSNGSTVATSTPSESKPVVAANGGARSTVQRNANAARPQVTQPQQATQKAQPAQIVTRHSAHSVNGK